MVTENIIPYTLELLDYCTTEGGECTECDDIKCCEDFKEYDITHGLDTEIINCRNEITRL